MDDLQVLPHLSPFRVVPQPDGSFCTIDGDGRVTCDAVEAVEDDQPELIQDWQTILGLPHDEHALMELAKPRGFSSRRLKFIVGDEGPTRRKDGRPLRPQEWIYAWSGTPFALEHLGLVVGMCDRLVGVPNDPVVRSIMDDIPEAVGNFLLGEALLYDSPLADAVWLGIQRGIFKFACPVLLRSLNTPLDSGELVEVCLTHRPVCLGARLLRYWEEKASHAR